MSIWTGEPTFTLSVNQGAKIASRADCELCEALPSWEIYSRIIVSTSNFKSYETTAAVSPLHLVQFQHRLSFIPI